MCGEQTCLQMTIAVHVEVPEDGDEDVVLLGLVTKWHRNRKLTGLPHIKGPLPKPVVMPRQFGGSE